ncbi:MAG: hypothetical protein O6926_09680 [candidate division NC10 bacterium]|nr:hypothetical protein [candidate division NC10 bacterium]
MIPTSPGHGNGKWVALNTLPVKTSSHQGGVKDVGVRHGLEHAEETVEPGE